VGSGGAPIGAISDGDTIEEAPRIMIRLAAALATTLGGLPADPPPPPASSVFNLERTVPRGEARAIAFYSSLFPDCTSQGPVVIRLLTPPRHGRTTIEPVQSFPQYIASSPLAECNSRKVPGQRIVYEGEQGYEGVDSFRILVINADGTGYESEIKVSVR
jgi:hypothetical protein